LLNKVKQNARILLSSMQKAHTTLVAKAYWLAKQDFEARSWDASDPLMADIRFPPKNYDAYVLISAGPRESFFGVVPEDDTGVVGIERLKYFYQNTMTI
jgi:hypothetical protein